jgi:hypothetical protein
MIKVNTKLLVGLAFFVVLTASSVAVAGDVDVRGNAPGDDSPVLDVQYTGSADDDIAVYGKCAPSAWWGVGGKFVGGWKGVEGYATMSGAGVRYGVYGIAGGGTSGHGVHGEGPVGVYGVAVGRGLLGRVFCRTDI